MNNAKPRARTTAAGLSAVGLPRCPWPIPPGVAPPRPYAVSAWHGSLTRGGLAAGAAEASDPHGSTEEEIEAPDSDRSFFAPSSSTSWSLDPKAASYRGDCRWAALRREAQLGPTSDDHSPPKFEAHDKSCDVIETHPRAKH